MTLSAFDAARRGALTQKLLGQLEKRKIHVEIRERWKALIERSKTEPPETILAEAGKLAFLDPKVVTLRGDGREYLCAFDTYDWMNPERNSLFWSERKGYFANTVFDIARHEIGEAWQHWAEFLYWDNVVTLWRREDISWLTSDWTPVKDAQILEQAKELEGEKSSEYDLSEFRGIIREFESRLRSLASADQFYRDAKAAGFMTNSDGDRIDPSVALELFETVRSEVRQQRDRLVRYARDRLETGRGGYFTALVDIDQPWENANLALYRESGLREDEFQLVSNGGLEELAQALNRPRSA